MAIPIHQFEAPLACPLDGGPLRLDGHSLACEQGHRFDIAKEGYANLLPVQFKNSKDPGDSKEMVANRRLVLDSHAYAPIAQGLAGQICELTAGLDRFRLLDAGCGEGYYPAQIAQHLRVRKPDLDLCVMGLDVSKWAVRAAAKKYKDLVWFVGTNRHLPLIKGDLDLITCLFGFPVWQHWADMQSDGQMVLMVDPARDHLRELREVIYEDVRFHDAPSLETAEQAGYRLISQTEIQAISHLQGQELISNLVGMTPHAHRMGEPGRQALAALNQIDVTVHVTCRLLQKS